MAPEAQLTMQWTGYQLMERENSQGRHGSQHFKKTYVQEEAKMTAADRVQWRKLLPIVLLGTGETKC